MESPESATANDQVMIFDTELVWPEFIEQVIATNINTSNCSVRESLLIGIATKLSKNDGFSQDLFSPLITLLLTIPHYIDEHTKRIIFHLFSLLHNSFNEPENPFIKAFSKVLFLKYANSITKMDPLTLYRIISWSTYVLTLSPWSIETNSFKRLLTLIITSLDSLALYGSSNSNKLLCKSKTILKSTLLNDKTKIVSMLDLVLKTDAVAGYNCVFLGLCADVHKLDEGLYVKFLDFYMKSVMSAKHSVSDEYLIALQSFVEQYVTLDVFKETLVPLFDRLILRSPEVVLKVLKYFVRYAKFDFSAFFKNKYAEASLDGMKSSNEIVKTDAFGLFKALCLKSADEECLLSVVGIMIKNMSSAKSVDLKALLYNNFTCIKQSPSISKKIIESLLNDIAKETNDQVLQSCLTSISLHLASIDDSKFITETIIPNCLKQIDAIKNSSQRKCFIFILSSLNTCFITEKIMACILNIIEKVNNAGISLLDASRNNNWTLCDGVLAVYIAFEYIEYKKSGSADLEKYPILRSLLESSKSFLLNEKFFLKLLTTRSDQLIFAKVISQTLTRDYLYSYLSKTVTKKKQSDIEISTFDAFANAITYCSVQATSHEVRGYFMQTLQSLVSRIYEEDENLTKIQSIVELLNKGIGGLVTTEESTRLPKVYEDDSVVRSSRQIGYRCYLVLQSIIPEIPCKKDTPIYKSIMKTLVDISILTTYKTLSVMGNDILIRFCLRANIDPVDLIQNNIDVMFDNWKSITDNDDSLVTKKGSIDAVCALVSLFTSVSPKEVMDTILPWIIENVGYGGVSESDIEIWRTPVGQICFDPLMKNGGGKVDDRPKSAAEKWDRDLRKELDKKKTRPLSGKKGTSATTKQEKIEEELVKQQLLHETETRNRVQRIFVKLQIGLDFLRSILSGYNFSFSSGKQEIIGLWTSKIQSALLYLLIIPELTGTRPISHALAGKKAVDLFIYLGDVSCNDDSYLHSLVHPRPILPIAILRALGVLEDEVIGLIPYYTKVTLKESLNRILAHVKSSYSPSNPLFASSFSYLFPILHAIVFKQGRISSFKEKTVTELCLLAADVLLSHSGLGNSPGIPRSEYTGCLIRLIELYPRLHESAKNGLTLFSMSIGTSSEQLPMDSPMLKLLLDNLLHENIIVRLACLQSLEFVMSSATTEFDIYSFILTHDEDEAVRSEAKRVRNILMDQNDMISENDLGALLDGVVNDKQTIRESSGRALCAALKVHQHCRASTLEKMFALYSVKAAEKSPEVDEYGMIKPETLNPKDEWESRSGIASALKFCAQVIENPIDIFEFLIEGEALGDKNESVRQSMLQAGLASLNAHGLNHIEKLIKVFNAYLSKPDTASGTQDRIREGVVILLGNVARHMDSKDKSISVVIDKLIETLKTPSEPVQIAVSECLPALVKLIPERVSELVDGLLNDIFNAADFATRRGSAFGLAGVVKGRGISTLKEFSIMPKLKEAVEDKKNSKRREGSLFAFETLSYSLGRLFEPYVIQILPLLLACYGDSNKDVRAATDETCRVIMSKLSGHCVKLVLPSLLNGLDDDNWRTKLGSVEVLGSMAFLAPKQLALSLPQVVPRLSDALGDSHAKVQEAAQTALKNFGQVIKNPEIQALVPVILAAFVDFNKNTNAALVALLDTAFVHYIDAPSLALIVPILQRGLKERSTDVKKRAAQIMGNMASLTDQKDLTPYLPTLLPGLKDVLVDPVPQARATAAKSLGLMVGRIGEANFPGLVSELFATLKSDTSAVDRSGAAQGLSEIISSLGTERLEGLLSEIVLNAGSSKAYVREGFMTLLIYLPATYGEKFKDYLVHIIPPVLKGLADESETVRDSALKAAQMIVKNYSKSAISLLLPELELGLLDENWRIRQSSLQIMGDLLYKITGSSVQGAENDDEDGPETQRSESSRAALINVLGIDRYYVVLSSIYIIRSDINSVVRQASMNVWKSIVSNTPRTLKEILPVMMNSLIGLLASNSSDQQGVSKRTLVELVQKLGENVLLELIPIFETGSQNPEVIKRKGVCIAISEIIAASGKQVFNEFTLQCIPIVRRALIDSESDVREAAAHCFDSLHQLLGARVIDEVLPSLLKELKSATNSGNNTEKGDIALEALKELMGVRSHVVLQFLIPTLIAKPITIFNAHALGSLISVASDAALNKRLNVITTALLYGLEQNDDAVPSIKETLKILVGATTGEGMHLLNTIVKEFMGEEESIQRKNSACEVVSLMYSCSSDVEVTTEYIGDWLTRMVSMLVIRNGPIEMETVKLAWDALDSICKSIEPDELDKFVSGSRKAIAFATENLPKDAEIDGFNLPKGISPLLKIFLHGLMYGAVDTRVQSALGLSDIVSRTSQASLKPFVTQITGPLIRVIGDRFPHSVKNAILEALYQLLEKVPLMLKPFLPQLQRTFVKSLGEIESPSVRAKASSCLSLLIVMQTRIDPLILELVTGIKSSEDLGVKGAMFESLYSVLKNVDKTKGISVGSKKSIEELLVANVFNSGENDDSLRITASKSLAAYVGVLSNAENKSFITAHIISTKDSCPWPYTMGKMCSILNILIESPRLFIELNMTNDIIAMTTSLCSTAEKMVITEICLKIIGKLIALDEYSCNGDTVKTCIPILNKALDVSEQTEIKLTSLQVLKDLCKANHSLIEPHVSTFVPSLMLLVKDRVSPVKLAADRTLMYVFQLNKNNSTILSKYIVSLNAANGRIVGDYARKMLGKISAQEDSSDAEK